MVVIDSGSATGNGIPTVIAESAGAVPQYVLVVSEKGGEERRTPFRSNELTVGRVQGNDLVLPKGNVSKRHARILYREGRFIVTDLNSTNGTYVNRQRIAQATIIREEDSIFIGDFVIRVEMRQDSSSSEPPPGLRELDAPIPTLTPDPEQSHAAVAHHSSATAWDRLSHAEEMTGRAAAGRATEPPPPADLSSTSQKFSDQSVGHRRAVALVVERVVARLGAPPLEPSSEYSDSAQHLASQIADQLLVDGLIGVGTSMEAVLQQAKDELLETGPLAELLREPLVTAIAFARYDELIETREGRQQLSPPGFSSAAALELALKRLALRSGALVEGKDTLDFTTPQGARFSVVMGPVAPQGPLGIVEKPRKIKSSLDDLVRRGAISRTMATFLRQCVMARLNLLVVGPRDEGAQIVLGALASAARERVVTLSDFDEFITETDQPIRLDLSRATADVAALLDIATAVPQARLLISLSTPAIATTLIEALGGGTNGVMSSLKASSLRRALLRLPADLAAQNPRLSLDVARDWVEASFDVALEVARLRDGRIRVLRIAEIAPDGHGALEPRDIFSFLVSRVAAGGAVEGSFVASGQIPRALNQLQLHGVRIETSMFSRPPST